MTNEYKLGFNYVVSKSGISFWYNTEDGSIPLSIEFIGEAIIEKTMRALNREERNTILERIESLESEYKAYHTTLYPTGQDSDYWRGVRYALDVLGGDE